MDSLLFLGLVSFLLSLLLTPLVRNLFRHLGILDHPDNFRKLHGAAIPRVGGIAIAFSYVLSFAFLLGSHLKGGVIVSAALPFVWRMFAAAGLIFVLGLLDDVIGLMPWQKLGGQTAAAGIAYWAGIRIHTVYNDDPSLWWSFPLTILWLVACTNAMNLIDGVDGLAAGIGLFASATALFAAILQNNVALGYAAVPLVGCLLGFLRYNFNPASIFLGDGGSLYIGFLLGCYGVLWSQRSATILGMTAPLVALSIPLLDMAVAIARRFARQQPIFTGDRDHIHHRLLDRGYTPRGVALVIYSLCGTSAIASLALTHQTFGGFVIIVFCAATWFGIQYLNYVEFRVAAHMFTGGAFRRLLHGQITLKSLEQNLEAAATLEDCWEVLRGAYREFGFHYIRVELGDQTFIDRADGDVPQCWELRVPLSDFGYIDLRHGYASARKHDVLVLFINTLEKTLKSRFEKTQRAPRYRTASAGD